MLAAGWGNQPANEVWFHPNNRSYYPFSNFYEIDRYHDAQRYPRQGIHNATAFQGLRLGLQGMPVLGWRSSEHFFQAMKFFMSDDLAQLSQQWNNQTPGNIFALVRARPRGDVFAHWHNVKLYIMYGAVKAKFSQNAALRDLLLQTNDAWVVEHVLANRHQPHGDNYWGDTNNGQNYLGKILMIVRKELSGAPAYPAGWHQVRLNTIQQAERDVLAHQQNWIAQGCPPLVNHHAEQLVLGHAVTLDVAGALQPNRGKVSVGASGGVVKQPGWVKRQFQDHPVLAPTITVLVGASVIELAWNGKNSIFLRPFKSKNNRVVLAPSIEADKPLFVE